MTSLMYRRAAELLALDLADGRYDPDETRLIIGALMVEWHEAQRREEKTEVMVEPERADPRPDRDDVKRSW